MFNFFKRKKDKSSDLNSEQQERRAAPGTQIRYSPDLVGKLKDDHKALFTIFGQIQKASDSGNYPVITKKLKEFKIALTDHLLAENVSLYIYLGRSFSHDEMNDQLVKGFKSEMNQIAKVVMAFLTKYETIGVNKDLAATFDKELEEIGAALVERINREESTLYPLYLPNY